MNALIINGKAIALDNAQIANIELALLKAQKDWIAHNATYPANQVQPILDEIKNNGAAYWQENDSFGQPRYKI